MTTIVGIEAGKNGRGVVLASDLAATRTDWKAAGDVAYREQTRRDFEKIYVGNDRNFVVAGAGIVDWMYNQFIADLRHGEINVEKAVKKGRFPELLSLNLGRFKGYVFDNDAANALLIACRYSLDRNDPERTPALFTCYPLGRIERRFYTSIGSGSKHALEYMNNKNLTDPRDYTLEEAVIIVEEAIEVASKDLHTRGSNIVIVAEDCIEEFGGVIGEELRNARRVYLESIGSRIRETRKEKQDQAQ